MKKTNIIVYLIAIAVFSAPTKAEEAADEPDTALHGEINSGLTIVNGNSKSTALNGQILLNQESEKFRHDIKFNGANTTSRVDPTPTLRGGNVRTSEQYFFSGQTDYKLTGANFLFALLEYEQDKFSGYDYQGGFSIGYGRQLFQSEKTELKFEFGPGYRRSNQETAININYLVTPPVIIPPVLRTPAKGETTLRLASKFTTKFGHNTEFSNELSATVGEEFTISRSDTALATNIIGNLYLKVMHTLKRQSSDIPQNAHNTDSELTLNLSYKF